MGGSGLNWRFDQQIETKLAHGASSHPLAKYLAAAEKLLTHNLCSRETFLHGNFLPVQ